MLKTSELKSGNTFDYEVLSRDFREELLGERKECLYALFALGRFGLPRSSFFKKKIFAWKSLLPLLCVSVCVF